MKVSKGRSQPEIAAAAFFAWLWVDQFDTVEYRVLIVTHLVLGDHFHARFCCDSGPTYIARPVKRWMRASLGVSLFEGTLCCGLEGKPKGRPNSISEGGGVRFLNTDPPTHLFLRLSHLRPTTALFAGT